MKKTTKKRSYKNAVSIGIAAFASVALLSTGLAAFVLIRNAQAEVEGNIVVAEVKDTTIALTAVLDTDTEDTAGIRLDADKNDKTGRVQFSDSEVGEKLTQKVKVTVGVDEGKNVYDNVKLTYQVDVLKPKLSEDGSETAEYEDAHSEFESFFIEGNRLEYSINPAPLGENVEFKFGEEFEYAFSSSDKIESVEFSFTFGFTWGEKYEKQNPSVFYDSESIVSEVAGKDVDINEVKTELENLHKNFDGYKFVVTIKAANK